MVKQPVHVASAMLALALLSFGCDPPPEVSDELQYELINDLGSPLGFHGHHALVGSVFKLEIVDAIGGEVDRDQGGLRCAWPTASGVVSELDDGAFVVTAAGPGAVEFADPGITCPANTDILADFGPDRWSVTGVDPADAIGRWAHFPDSYVLGYRLSPGPRGVFPDALGRPIDELLVVGDSPFAVVPALVRMVGDEEVEVRWRDIDHELTVPAHYDHLRPRLDDGSIFPSLEGIIGAGESVTTSVTILGNSFELPVVRAVPLESIQSIELVPVYDMGDTQREWGPPRGVIAIPRDGEGRRVFEAPLEFELTDGYLSFGSERDTLYLGDVCRRPPQSPTVRTASVSATIGDVAASADLKWIALPDDNYSPDSECVQACACTSAPPGESTPRMLALVGLGIWLRRRRRG